MSPGKIMTARALRYHGRKDLRIEDLPIDTSPLKNGEVRLRPAWCGICGTDVHEYLHGPVFPPSKEAPHPLTGDTMPIILGHEFSGTVTEVGPGVEGLTDGSAVAVEGVLTDKSCYACSIGKKNICDNSAFLGLSGGAGGLCTEIVLPAECCHLLPPRIPLDIAAMIEPLSVAWHAVDQSGIKPGQSSLVLGAGPIGLAVILCLKAVGVKNIIVSEPSKARYDQATKLGATAVLNPVEQDVVLLAKELCDKVGPDVAYDASGLQLTLTTGIRAIRKGGTHYNIALWGSKATIDPNDLLFYGKKIQSDLSYAYGDYQAVIKAISEDRMRLSDLQELITAKIDLEDTEAKGIQELIDNKEKHIKILVRVDKELELGGGASLL